MLYLLRAIGKCSKYNMPNREMYFITDETQEIRAISYADLISAIVNGQVMNVGIKPNKLRAVGNKPYTIVNKNGTRANIPVECSDTTTLMEWASLVQYEVQPYLLGCYTMALKLGTDKRNVITGITMKLKFRRLGGDFTAVINLSKLRIGYSLTNKNEVIASNQYNNSGDVAMDTHRISFMIQDIMASIKNLCYNY